MSIKLIHKAKATIKARLGNKIYVFEAMLFEYRGWSHKWFLLNNENGFAGAEPSSESGWRKLGYKHSWCIGHEWYPGSDDIISIRIKPQGFFTRKIDDAT